MKKTKLIFLALFGLMASPLQADFFGPANGRSANLDKMSNMSVEAGVNLKGDFTTIGGRFNYKVSPDLMVFGDLGQSNWFGSSGFTYGAGAFYQLRNVTLLENTDLAVKGSFHTGKFDFGFCGFFDELCEISISELALEVIISGDQLATTDFGWYANGGFHSLDSGSNIGLGGGIIGSLSFGEWYAGIDIVDQFFLVAGVRYNLN